MYFRFYYYMYGSNIGQLSIWKMNNRLIVMCFRFYYYMYSSNIGQLSIWKMNNHLIVMYFRFYYYMYGGNIGQLSIWKMGTNNQLIGSNLWTYPSKAYYFYLVGLHFPPHFDFGY